MEVDTAEVPCTSRSCSAGAAVRPKTKGASTSQTQAWSTGPCHRAGPKTKQRATDQQGVHTMVTNVMERQIPKAGLPGGPSETAYLGRPSPSWSAPCHVGRCFGRRMAS